MPCVASGWAAGSSTASRQNWQVCWQPREPPEYKFCHSITSTQHNAPCRRLVGNPLRFRPLSEVRLYRRPSAMRTCTKKIACNRKKGNISPSWTWGEGGEIFGELDDSPRSPKLPQNILKAVGGLAVSFKSLFKIITRIEENGIFTFSKRSIDTTAVFVC